MGINSRKRAYYSEAVKRQAVMDVVVGKQNVHAVSRKYGIGGSMTIRKWMAALEMKTGETSKAALKGLKDKVRITELEAEKEELKRVLTQVTLEKYALETLIKEAEERLGVRIKKNFGMGR